jgi:signal recognition particle subunit SRP19
MFWILILSIAFCLIISLNAMVSRDGNRLMLWPEYFDKTLTKDQGRRVPLKLAVNNPTLEEIAKASKRLKLIPKIESNKSYPGRWWRKSGRVLIRSKVKKTKIIRQVAIIIKKHRK